MDQKQGGSGGSKKAVVGLEERKVLLAQHVVTAVAFGARIEWQSDTMAVLVSGQRVNHLLHFIVGLFTLGLWWLVWILLAIFRGENREVITVDDYGNILDQKQREVITGL